MTSPTRYQPTNKVRFITAASLFDGHDAAINIMRRILQVQAPRSSTSDTIGLSGRSLTPLSRKTCRESRCRPIRVAIWSSLPT